MSPAESPRAQRAPSAVIGRTSRQLLTAWRAGGMRGISSKVLRSAVVRLAAPVDELGIAPADVTAPVGPLPTRGATGRGPMSVGWVMGPPSAGSGGHTTLFRLIRGLERRGHTNVIHIYDRHCPGDVRTSRDVIGAHFPPMAARLADSRELEVSGAGPYDALVATSWPTAYVVRSARSSAPRGYLVQDFEPWFHPVGSAATLAEATYRFGFHGICAGPWLRQRLEADYGMTCDSFDFGVDTGIYHNHERGSRRAVVFYARPCTPRRGFGLGLLALGLLAARRGDIDIHLFGEDLGGLQVGFPCFCHGALAPAAIDDLFNRCAAGLVLSFTNLSLLPLEMLATGCVPVVNDAPQNRMVLDDPSVRYVDATPEALADALEAAVDAPDRVETARRAAAGVTARDWDDAVTRVEGALCGLTGRRSGDSP